MPSITLHPTAAGRAAPVAGSAFVHRLVLFGLLAWVALGCAGQLHLVLRDSLVHSVDVVFDDAYYYLGVAWNLANGHGSRFTEPLPTNGYHPLWLLLLTGATAAFDLSKQGLLCAVLVLTAIAKGLGIWLFGHGEVNAWRRSAGRVAIGIAIIKFPFVFSLGLETTLFVVFIPCLLRLSKVRGWSARHALAVGCVLSLVFLTRIDALALDAAVLAICLATRRTTIKGAALALVPLAVALAAYLAVNLHAFGTPLPVSGQAKAIGSHFAANLGTSLDYAQSMRWALLMLALWGAARLTVARRLAFGVGFELACLTVAWVACALYYGAMSGWPIWPWYLYPNAFLSIYATIAGLAGAAALLNFAAGRLLSHRIAPRTLTRVVGLAGGLFALGYLAQTILDDDLVRPHLMATVFGQETRNPSKSSFNQQNVALIPWLDQHYPAGALLAMGDRAGGLGYWMSPRHRMIQTEGLVADKAFLGVLRAGRLDGYLAEQRVDLYVTDRPRTFSADGMLGFVEPVQPRVTGGPLNLLCFDPREQLLSQDYRWGDEPQLRRVFDFKRRVACPARLLADVRALQTRYDAIRTFSGF